MKMTQICLLGGTGFVGRRLATILNARRISLCIPTRHPQRHRDLQLLEQVQLVTADIHDSKQLEQLFKSCDAVINLVGILNANDKKGKDFDYVHVELAKKVINAAQHQGIRRLLHMSALHAEDTPNTSHYLRSKAKAETLTHTLSGRDPIVTSFRPSVIFGPGGDFLTRFRELLESIPFIFPLACPRSRFQPVYVGDVAEVFANALDDYSSYGKRINLCGPKTYTLHELVAYVARLSNLKRYIIDLPDWVSRMQAIILERVPGKPFTMDNYRSLRIDSICASESDLCPTPLESIAPQYLGDQNQSRQYDRLRDHSQY
ncbi:complex I NDUFA9 subunit family protein [Acidihalobacter prosperus]